MLNTTHEEKGPLKAADTPAPEITEPVPAELAEEIPSAQPAEEMPSAAPAEEHPAAPAEEPPAPAPVKRPSCWKLFSAFNRIGAFTFGGGYAMLPMLERECVEKNGWVTREELLDYFAIGQCTPGVIAVNTATFVGKKQRGFWGAFAATAGVVLPSFIIICILTALLANFASIPAVKYALHGVRVCVGVLILNTVIKLVKEKIKDVLGYVLCAAAFLVVAVFKISPVFVVIAAALVGIVRGFIVRKGAAKR